VFPPLAVGLVAATIVRAHLRRARDRRTAARAVADGLPEAVVLLLLCCGAGIALPLAQPLVARHLPPPIGPALLAAEAASDAGQPRADSVVRELGRLGDRATALAHVLADHLHYGVPLAPALERLGLELRLERRRRAEQDARRVPIRLLGPLVTCVLPAFGLLTVVPLLVASLQSLPT
jgi:tight adherence protein C